MEAAIHTNTQISTRLDVDLHEKVKRLAEILYDGNEAMLARIAVRKFVSTNEHLLLESGDQHELSAA